MSNLVSRRAVLKALACASAGVVMGPGASSRPASIGAVEVAIAGRPIEIQVSEISKYTVRITAAPLQNGLPVSIPNDGSLIEKAWSLGYQQSHRTLASRDEVLRVARTFREKKLPCDALIYLSTGFTPSGWNTANGSFA